MADLVAILAGYTLPEQTTLVETTTPLETENITLDGSLYTDFTTNRRSWAISFALLSRAQYDAIRNIYLDQYRNEAYPTFNVATENISTTVKMNISEKDLRFNGDCIEGFKITLKEADAIN